MTDVEHDYGFERRSPATMRVAELAERQWGVVSTADLRALGMGRRQADHWLQAGRLRPLHRGVYAVGHAALRIEGTWMAAVLACGPGALLSHQDAAALWGFGSWVPRATHVTVSRKLHHQEGIRVHWRRRPVPEDASVLHGIPVTAAPRTLLDLAAHLGDDRFEATLARARQLRVVDTVALEEVLARAEGHRGRGRLARAVTGEPKLTRSTLERLFLALVRRARLPEPETNVWMTFGGGEEMQIDVLWRDRRVSVELDSWQFHSGRRSFERDRARAATLVAAGHRHLQLTWRQIAHESEWVVATLEAVLQPGDRR